MTWVEWTAIGLALLIAYKVGFARGRVQGLTEFRGSMEQVARDMKDSKDGLDDVVRMFREAVRILRGEADG